MARSEHPFEDVDAQPDAREWIRVLDAVRAEPMYAAYKKRIVELLAPRRGGTYLEVGCGTGDDALALACAYGAIVLAGDASTAMVAEARRRGLADAAVADAHALPFGDASFDGAWADRAFQHLADPAQALAELVRVTRPGGTIVVADPDYANQAVAVEDQNLARRVLCVRSELSIRNGTLAHRVPELLAAAGLDDVHSHEFEVVLTEPTALDNALGLRDWVLTARRHGLVGEDEVNAWRHALDRAAAENRFRYSFSIFVTGGRVPTSR
jgi:SAM-dependent methyltransferase